MGNREDQQRWRAREKREREINQIIAETEKLTGMKLSPKWRADIAAHYESEREQKDRARKQVELAALAFPEGQQRDQFRKNNNTHTKLYTTRTRNEMRDRLDKFKRADEEAEEAYNNYNDFPADYSDDQDDPNWYPGRAYSVALDAEGNLCRGRPIIYVDWRRERDRLAASDKLRAFARAEVRYRDSGPHGAAVISRPEYFLVSAKHAAMPFLLVKRRGKVVLPERKPPNKITCKCATKDECIYKLDPRMCSNRAGFTPKLPIPPAPKRKPIMTERGWDKPSLDPLEMEYRKMFGNNINGLAKK